MKNLLLPIVVIALVGITAVGATVYVMKGSSTPAVVTAPAPTTPALSAPTPLPPAPATETPGTPAPTTATLTPTPGNDPQNPGMSAERQQRMQQFLDRMAQQLNLTDAQKQQIAQIRANTALDRQQRREAMRNVLTPDQQAQWEQMRAQMRNRRGGGQGGPGGPGGGQNAAPAPATTPAPAPGT